MLNRLKKRRVIEELPGGRYRLSSRKAEGDNAGHGPRGAGSQGQAPSRTGAPVSQARHQNAGHASIANRDEIKGRLVLHHDGYGFVVPDAPVPGLDRDVFVPREAIEDAMHGDHVLVRVQRVAGASGALQRAE